MSKWKKSPQKNEVYSFNYHLFSLEYHVDYLKYIFKNI